MTEKKKPLSRGIAGNSGGVWWTVDLLGWTVDLLAVVGKRVFLLFLG